MEYSVLQASRYSTRPGVSWLYAQAIPWHPIMGSLVVIGFARAESPKKSPQDFAYMNLSSTKKRHGK